MSAKQIVILTATFVGLVVIVTLAKVYLGGLGSKETGQKPVVVLAEPHLTFAHASETAGTWLVPGPANRFDPQRPPEEEMGCDGHYDFWFKNDTDKEVTMLVTKFSCNRCLHLDVALAPEGWQEAQAAAMAALGPAGALSGAAQATADKPAPGPDVAWETLESQELNKEAKGFAVPPKRAGWARLAWKDEEAGGKLLAIDLKTTQEGVSAPPLRLQYGAIFVEPVRVLPESKLQALVEPLNGGDKRETWFTVYSSTRPEFQLDPEPDDVQQKRHPFVICGKPAPLTRKQCDDLQKEQKRVVLCGYKVPVTVHERLEDGREHDLGPFRWLLPVKSGVTEAPIGLSVAGTVVNPDITVLSESEATRDRVAFGTFSRERGDDKRVTVEAPLDSPLRIDKKPDFLEVKLTEDPPVPGQRKKTWSLTVSIPPRAVSGHFPNPDDPATRDTAIYLMAKGRRIRIPVSGTASQR